MAHARMAQKTAPHAGLRAGRRGKGMPRLSMSAMPHTAPRSASTLHEHALHARSTCTMRRRMGHVQLLVRAG